jgi:hypothetical protein
MSIRFHSPGEPVVRTTIGNEVILEAMRRERGRREREAIDDDIRGMAKDPAYLAEQRQVMAEFGGRT